ncbi:MAG: VCBS repeat-containing protein, partial [Pirellulaceae bacterium]
VNWTTLRTFVDGEDDNQYHFYEFEIPVTGDTLYVRFDAEMGDSKDYWYIDDVQLAASGPPNTLPVASDDVGYSVDEDSSLNVAATGVLANDSDADGDQLTAVLVTGVSNGSLTLNADGSFVYSPSPNFSGSDSFSYSANDGSANSNTAIVSIAINPLNDAPVSAADSYNVGQDTTLNIAAAGVLSNDSDPDGDAIAAVLDSGPTNGALTLFGNGAFDYTPNAGFTGVDSFTYHSTDGSAASNIATVSISVDGVSTTKFFVVDDAADDTFEYQADGTLVTNYNLGAGNNSPRGAASNIAGDTVWVIDNDDFVYVHDDEGTLLGSWRALGLNRPEGIASNGTDIWIVDRGTDEVTFFSGAAGSIPSTDLNATSSFALANGNGGARGITTDGTHIWVVDDGRNADTVFKYNITGSLVGSWTIDSANAQPRGITIDPSNVDDIWIVDATSDSVYQYNAGASRDSGSQTADAVFSLAAGNTNPQGIADPPPVSNHSGESESASNESASNESNQRPSENSDARVLNPSVVAPTTNALKWSATRDEETNHVRSLNAAAGGQWSHSIRRPGIDFSGGQSERKAIGDVSAIQAKALESLFAELDGEVLDGEVLDGLFSKGN